VTAVRVAAREIQRIVESVGTLYAYDEAIISAEVDGRVDRVNIDLGDAVTTGQVLVQIYDEEQRYLLAQNEAQLRQSLERLGLKDEKDRVKDVRETPEVRQAQAEFFEAEQRFKRVRNLVDQGISSRADLDQAQARYQATQAALDATMNQTRNLIQEIERAKAVLELQRKKLRDTTVRAPFAGFVKERQVTVGQYARANTPLLTLVKTNPIRLRLEIPERMAPWVKTEQTVEVALEAFEGRTFRGRIWRISPAVDPSKRTFVAEALIDNPDHQLKPGSYAKARVPTNKRDRILTIPFRSVNYVFGTNKAYVVDDGVIQSRDVKMGDRFDQQVEIVEGLQEGEQVATSQVSRLDNGVKVRVVSDRPGRQTEKGATGSKSTD
jgi:multidrug efflux pump subunit AcrA (membrane-fusion protein)